MVQIPVSESVAQLIAQRVAERQLSGASDYIERLVADDHIQSSRRQIDQALREALMDDPSSDWEWTAETKAAWRRETQRRLGLELTP